MSQNPFIYGKPIDQVDQFIGRADELSRILANLNNSASTAIVGERRMGKTSLLKILAQQPPFDSKHHYIYLDMSQVDMSSTPTDFWKLLLRHLQRTLPHCPNVTDMIKELLLKETTEKYIKVFDMSDVFAEIKFSGEYIMLLLDEFDHVVKNSNFDVGFFSGLRSLAIHHTLALVTTSYNHLSQLSDSDEIRSSPFFNIFDTLYLGSFKPAEVEELFKRSEVAGIRFTNEDRKFITSIAGRYPYYLQIGCKFLFDTYTKMGQEQRKAEVKQQFMAQAKDSFAYSFKHSSDAEKISLIVLALLNRNTDDRDLPMFSGNKLNEYYHHASYTLDGLVYRGLVLRQNERQNEQYALFSALFAEWLRHELRAERSPQSFEEWANQASNKGKVARLPSEARNLLPGIKDKYWDLISGWLTSDMVLEAMLGGAVKLLKFVAMV